MKRTATEPQHRSAVLLGLALLFVLALSITPLASDDVWINIKAGERIWRQHAIPAVDDYSFTQAGSPWVNHEWLANVVFWATWEAGGVNGLIFLKAALLLLTALVLLRFARAEEASPVVTALMLAAVAFAASDRFIERAHLFNFLMIALYLQALFRAREGEPPRLWRLPLLQALWVNLHSGAILGPMMVGLFLAGAGARAVLGRSQGQDRANAKWLAATLGLVVVASLANPYFGSSLLYPFQQAGMSLYRQYVFEWMPIWSPVYSGTPMALLFYACVGFVAVTFLVGAHRPSLEDLLVTGFFFVLALSAARFTAKFEIAALFVATRRLRRLRPSPRFATGAGVALATAIALVVALGNPIRAGVRPFGLGLDSRRFPEGACKILESVPGGVRLYNQYDLGSWLIWRLDPHIKVFIDGRNQVFPESLYREYLSANESPDTLNHVFEKWGIDAVLLDNDARIPAWLSARPDWHLVWWDDFTFLLLADRPGREALLAEHAYRVIHPALPTFEADLRRALARTPDDVIRELSRAAREAETAALPRAILASCCHALGRNEDAARWQHEADRLHR
ncbi:MAG: hypothetical protein HY292_01360 [Planctomycetes bacterium]|nr:hypothetical protein [Planctomycetota bacterium]